MRGEDNWRVGAHRRSTCKHQSITAEQLQIGKNKIDRKKATKYRFNKVRQLPTFSGQKGREILLINQL